MEENKLHFRHLMLFLFPERKKCCTNSKKDLYRLWR